MSSSFSRRQLAKYAVDELVAKRSSTDIAQLLAAALISSGRQKEADLLIDDIAERLETQGLLARASVISANTLSASLREQLSDHVKKAVQVESVSLREKIDPLLIGGFRIETSTRTWDKTIARKLAEIKGGI